MSLPNYLAQIKSSGIYRFVFDKSQMPLSEAQTMRLIVGYSEKGPFNTPVYINGKDKETFKKIFGDINKRLERKGIFFHRMAMQALEAGPIYCLNLKSIKDEEVSAVTFDAASAMVETTIRVADIYDRSRFWFLDPDKMINLKGTGSSSLDKYVSITCTDEDKSSSTIYVRPFVPTGYNVTFRDWFSKNTNGETMPEYLDGHEDEKVQDYFAEVYVFKGEINKQIATSESLKPYFTISGEDIYLNADLKNAFGESIDPLQALASDPNSNFINSYSGILLPEFKNVNNTIISLDAQFNQDNSLHKLLMSFDTDSLYDVDDKVLDLNTTGFSFIESITVGAPTLNEPAAQSDEEDGVDVDGDAPVKDTTEATEETPDDGVVVKIKDGAQIFSVTSIAPKAALMSYNEETDEWTADQDSAQIIVYPKGGSASDNGITLDASLNNVAIKVGDKIWSEGIYTITSINKVIEGEDTTVTITAADSKGEELTELSNLILLKKSLGAATYEKSLKGTYMKGYVYQNSSDNCGTSMNDKLNWQNSILNCLKEFKGIRLALTSRVDINYSYIVDTFEAFPSEEIHSQLSIIASEKENCFAFLNTPFVKTLTKCDYTKFTNQAGEFDSAYIVEGGNRMKPMSRELTIAREPNGASHCGYFTGLIIKENGVNKTIPSAAAVSNAFMEKYDNAFPYSVVAGPNRGRIYCEGLVGPEFNWSRYDLDNLEPFGINCIIYVPGKGVYINSNKTAKKDPISALSAINVRELVTYLQDKVEYILQTYHWEFNTPELRATVKTLVDKLCEDIKANGGLYDYMNVCDESNNTDEVIDNEMFVIDTAIEPGRGAGKMVQKLTIYRKGGIKASFSE